MAIAAPAHRVFQFVGAPERGCYSGILDPCEQDQVFLVCLDKRPLAKPKVQNFLAEAIAWQTYHATGIVVDQRSQTLQAFECPDIDDIRDPNTIW